MIELQYFTFKWQNISSVVIFIPALVIMGVLINSYPTWAYSPDIILKNEDFNTILFTTIIMGLVSVAFAMNPSWMAWVGKTNKGCGGLISKLDMLDVHEEYNENKEFDLERNIDRNCTERIIDKEVANLKMSRPNDKDNNAEEFDEVDNPIAMQQNGTINKSFKIHENDHDGKKNKIDENATNHFEKEEKSSLNKSQPRLKIFIPLLVGIMCLLFVVSPLVIAYLLTDLGISRTAYIYYNDQNNEPNRTIITQVCVVWLNCSSN